ncbi:energy transducer TonB [Ancylomarina euxinus]|uniref:Energy transducer TonB n=1 Tax=Ancylomarina euxinus TaxID=2283627 RepID=A0A425XXZ1_9BACT|nr:energy transducer TonB [Ancylomarina euxinus]MCZ4695871.1 energy transducer TonB [Ancylomarina euxinus]MUP16246.1 TonB family protein [Ancylomarina euxinus]RRG19617.1 energy transducer TonB [Ancylomarina euxinus]
MLPKKRENADLEKKKSLFFEIGLAIALLLVLIAFKWRVQIKDTELITNPQELNELEEIVPITRQEPERPKVKPPVKIRLQDVITIVENDSKEDPNLVIEEEDINQNTEIDISPPEEVSYDTEIVDETEIFVVVEDMPIFRPDICSSMAEGNIELNKHIQKSIKYPALAQENGITGRVFVRFIVGRDGKVKNAEILRGIDPSLDQEALRVIRNLPAFAPGKQRGVPVQVTYSASINFVLQ